MEASCLVLFVEHLSVSSLSTLDAAAAVEKDYLWGVYAVGLPPGVHAILCRTAHVELLNDDLPILRML